MSNVYPDPDEGPDEEFDDELDEGLEGAPVDDEVSEEDRARAMGWKPFDEYRGDPRRWTDYPEFLRKGEEELPILRDQGRRMSERLARVEPEMQALRNTVAEQAQAIRDAVSLARKADQRGYDRARAELLGRQREAVAAADTEAYDQVSEELSALEAARAEVEPPEPPPAPPPPPAAPAMDPAISAFVASNAGWFNDPARPALRQAMIGIHNAVIQEREITDIGEQLEESKRRLALMYPQHTDLGGSVARPRPRPRVPSTLTPRGPGGDPPARRSSPFEQIENPEDRKEARAAYDRMRRHDDSLTEGEYVAIYLDPKADVLELRNKRKK